MKKVSIIVPCYNEEESVPLFYEEVKKVFKERKEQLELIYVDDGSSDNSLKVIKSLKEDPCVKYISFSRNFGKEAAMYAGLMQATGNYITIMDVDLQDPPSLLPEMIRLIEEEGYDIVGTRRVTRKGEPPIRSFFARCFYKLINKMSNVEMVDGARDFRLMKRIVVDNILRLSEYNRYSKGLFSFVGFKTKYLEYENIERVAGTTKWSFWKLFKYAIEGIVAFTTIPLILSFVFGILFFIAAIVMFILALTTDYSSLYHIIWIILFSSSIILMMLGVIGEYLSKTYLEVKNRPVYVVRETNIHE
jgi:glycosyltransferase involved in cell wall biosynthesis